MIFIKTLLGKSVTIFSTTKITFNHFREHVSHDEKVPAYIIMSRYDGVVLVVAKNLINLISSY